MSRQFSSQELHRQHGFSYRIAREEHGEAIVRLVGVCFAREPMSRALGITAQEWSDLVGRSIPEYTTNGLSVIVVSEEAPQQLAGVLVNRDFKLPRPAGIPEDFPRFGPIFKAVGGLDEAYEAQVPGLQPGQAVKLAMAGVDPESRFAGRGIARNLARVSAELVRGRGFQRCIAECTGSFSQRAAAAAGFQERASVIYKDLVFEGRPIFAAVPEPHVKLALYDRVFSGRA